MISVTKGLRLHIGVFGRRNVGKSSIVNALTGQDVSIVSEVPGTTTDPVEKTMELKPIGPVVFIDTAGIDDVGLIGGKRVRKADKALERIELALLVTDRWTEDEVKLIERLTDNDTPFVVVANKCDLREGDELERLAKESGATLVATTSASDGLGFDQLRDRMVEATPVEFFERRPIIGDFVAPDDLVLLVTPIDIEAPKGRLKMLQVHCMREILDRNARAVIVKETELEGMLADLRTRPALIAADSQVFDKVIEIADFRIPATTFSILMARFKGDLEQMAADVRVLGELTAGDRVLIAEACTHHPIGEDIGRVQIPRMLEELAGDKLRIEVTAGRDFPADLGPYKLVVHCGACVFNRKQVLWRIRQAKRQKVAITNYGLAMTYCQGLLERALEPFTGKLQACISSA